MEQFLSIVVLPIALGLLGFVEPCSIGSALIFIKHLEGQKASAKLAQVAIFALTRAVFIGLLGVLAVILGTAFLGLQRGAWIVLGSVYAALGLIYVSGKSGAVMASLGPRVASLKNARGSVAFGLLFGLNIPACAAPLLFALLGGVAAGGASGAPYISGFVSLGLFGLALSLPLIAAVLFPPARRALDWLVALSRRVPFWTGLLFIALGAWSIWLAARMQSSS